MTTSQSTGNSVRGTTGAAIRSSPAFTPDLLAMKNYGDRRVLVLDIDLCEARQFHNAPIFNNKMENSDHVLLADVGRNFDPAIAIRLSTSEPALHALQVF